MLNKKYNTGRILSKLLNHTNTVNRFKKKIQISTLMKPIYDVLNSAQKYPNIFVYTIMLAGQLSKIHGHSMHGTYTQINNYQIIDKMPEHGAYRAITIF